MVKKFLGGVMSKKWEKHFEKVNLNSSGIHREMGGKERWVNRCFDQLKKNLNSN